MIEHRPDHRAAKAGAPPVKGAARLGRSDGAAVLRPFMANVEICEDWARERNPDGAAGFWRLRFGDALASDYSIVLMNE